MGKVIDDIDSKMINLLQIDGRMPNTEMAKRLNVSEASIRKRLKRLINEEIIVIAAAVNSDKFGNAIEGNLKIKVDTEKIDHIKQSLYPINGIVYLAHLTGAIDFDVDFSLRTQEELRKLLKTVSRLDGVRNVEVSFRLERMKLQFDILHTTTKNRVL